MEIYSDIGHSDPLCMYDYNILKWHGLKDHWMDFHCLEIDANWLSEMADQY